MYLAIVIDRHGSSLGRSALACGRNSWRYPLQGAAGIPLGNDQVPRRVWLAQCGAADCDRAVEVARYRHPRCVDRDRIAMSFSSTASHLGPRHTAVADIGKFRDEQIPMHHVV